MKPSLIVLFSLLASLTGLPGHADESATGSPFSVRSPTLADGSFGVDQVLNGFGCTGKNISPEISWSDAPRGTKAFSVLMIDKDAPTESGWWHWVVFNIPANVNRLALGAGGAAGKLPAGAIQSGTDFGKPGYGGPCPPPGAPHHYRVVVFALKDRLPLQANATAAMVNFYSVNLMLGRAQFEATYGR